MSSSISDPSPIRPTQRRRFRRGFSILETQVAFVLLGIGLAGVCPLIIMQVKLSKRLATGFEQNGQLRPGGRTYIMMQPDRWARKLGSAATLGSALGGSSSVGTPSYVLTLLDPVPAPYGNETLHLRVSRVSVTAPGAGGGGGPP
jgi:hypothetical protein